jgi:radical SAM superfamily enzyme YgiQ (UPF0313 family)
MRVALLNPKLKTWSPNVYPPLGLCYIASALENAGHKVSIIDLNASKISDKKLAKQISDVDVIGITGLITEYNEVIRLSNVAKLSNKHAKIVIGGALATTHTKEVLSKSSADYVVIGEGEIIIVKLLSAIENNEDLSSIKGLAYKSNGLVQMNDIPDIIENLDTISFPARRLLNMEQYTTHHFKSYGMKTQDIKSTTLLSSRSCPYKCEFCYHGLHGYKWRGRSPQNMITEIMQLHYEYGFDGFVFNDDTFVVDKKRVLEFCRLLKESNLNIKWYCNGRVNLMDEEIIRAMKESGCVGIAYGIESGNQDILNSIKKAITIEQIEKITALTKKYGIYVTGYFMIGILGETKENIEQTLEFARKLDLDFYGFTMTSPVIGTPMYFKAQEQGFKVTKELEDFSFSLSINMTKDVTDKELEQYNKDAFREFTIEKRYGKHYLFNLSLWFDGFKSVLFLLGKRNVGILFQKAWGVIKG